MSTDRPAPVSGGDDTRPGSTSTASRSVALPPASSPSTMPAMTQPRPPSTFTPRVVRAVSSATQTPAPRNTTSTSIPISGTRRPSFPAASSGRRPAWGSQTSVPTPAPQVVSFPFPPYLENAAFHAQLKADFASSNASKGPQRSGDNSATGSRTGSGTPSRRHTTAGYAYSGYPQPTSSTSTPSPMDSEEEDDGRNAARPTRIQDGGYLAKISINPEEEVYLVPSRWNDSDRHPSVQVSADGRDLTFLGTSIGQDKEDAASARANFSIPPICGVYYYEVEILNKGNKGHIGVGFGTGKVKLNKLPGWETDSWGYHGDDGNVFSGPEGPEKEPSYGPKFSTGDVVGCGVDFSMRRLFFTKNGAFLGHVFWDVSGELYPLVGLRTSHESVRSNFGQYPFRFDIESYYQQARNKAWKDIQETSVKWEIDNQGFKISAWPPPERDADWAPNMERIPVDPPSLPPIPRIRLNVLADGSLGVPYLSEPSIPEAASTPKTVVVGKEWEGASIRTLTRELVFEYLVQLGYQKTAGTYKSQCDAEMQAENKASQEVDELDVQRLGPAWAPTKRPNNSAHADADRITVKNRPVGGPDDFEVDTGIRQFIMEAIRAGQIELALQELDTRFPEVVTDIAVLDEAIPIGIKFKLKCRQFVEMILASVAEGSSGSKPNSLTAPRSPSLTRSRSGPPELSHPPISDAMDVDGETVTHPAPSSLSYRQQQKQREVEPTSVDLHAPPASGLDRALAFGQTLHADYKNDQRPDVQALLKKTSSLVAYVNPLDVKEAGEDIATFAGQRAREELALEVNSALLAFQGRRSDSSLERLYRQAAAVVRQLGVFGEGKAAFADIARETFSDR